MRPGDGIEEPEPAGLADPRAPWEELIEDPQAPRRLLAVMFTDIVGSTELAAALGDARWRELVDQHHAAIRSEIARYGGREVDTAGDAFFATFDLPVRAVDCALEALRSVRRLGLRIRAGVHMGECVVSNGAVRGVTVHIGARVGAKARGGELLVSSTIRDVLAGAGLVFRERGEQPLKGIEGRWRLYAVEPRVRDAEGDLPPLLEAELKPPELPPWRRPRTLVALGTALVVLIGGIAFVVFRGPGGLTSVAADSVALIDAGSLAVKSAVKVGARPVGLAATRDGVWVANSFDRSVSFVSSDGRSVNTIGGLGATPTSVAVSPNLVWITNADGKTISRVSPATANEVGERIVGGNGLADISYGAGAIWVTNGVDGTVWRVDSRTGARTHSINVGPALRGIAVADDGVWVTSELGQNVTKIDPRSPSVVAIAQVGRGPRAVAVGAGAVWVANAFDGTVSRVEPSSGRVSATIRVGEGPRAIAVARGKVFVANEYDSTRSVSVIDAGSNRVVKHISLENPPMGLAADGDRVWVSVRGGSVQYRGGTLRVGTSINLASEPEFGPAVSFDPPFAFPQLGFAIMPALYDGLVGFKQVGGVEGAEVVPNLAEDIRLPTNGGATYSFTLRRGLRYSDGSEVKASDVRASFERVYRVDVPRVQAALFKVIKGTERCSAAACDLSAAIVTDDTARTVTFHLRGAVSDFPAILALPGASLVPAKTPPRNMVLEPIPGTGPYRLASAKGDAFKGGEAILERNPHFRPRGLGQPGGYADRIVVSWGGTPTSQVEAVKAGRSDWTIDAQEPEIDARQLAVDVPAQLHIFDLPSVTYATLNPNVPPFNDVKARRALNLAVDRAAIARVFEYSFGAKATCQVLPKNMIGFRPYCPYTANPNASGQWSAPNLPAARRLVAESGTAETSVTVWLDGRPSPWRPKVATIIAKALRDIGYRASVQEFDGDLIEAQFTGRPQIQIAIEGWATDYPAASSFFVPLLACNELVEKLLGDPAAGFNLARFCSKEVDQKIERALAAQRDDVAEAGDLWADVDRLVTDQAPWVPLSTLHIPVLVSARLGNVLMNPALGPLLTQMWVVEEPKAKPS